VPNPGPLAKRAASAPSLATKAKVSYFELPTRRFITPCSSPRMPFPYTINPYRGCEFGCKYCYARYTHEFLELRESIDFERKIYAKSFHKPAFRAELASIPRADHIAIGTATDPYQPAERRFRITRQILEVFAGQEGRKLSITTKSDLVARDIDILKMIARVNVVFVHMTITTVDPNLARLLEPMAPVPSLRLEALRTLSAAGIQTGVFCHPVMPAINDGTSSLEAIAEAARKTGVHHFSAAPVFLKPCAQQVFLPFLEESFPHLAERYRERFTRNAFLRGPFVDDLRERAQAIREKYGLERGPVDYEPEEWEGEPQLTLFPLAGGK
jgi:DNA repair photolyase